MPTMPTSVSVLLDIVKDKGLESVNAPAADKELAKLASEGGLPPYAGKLVLKLVEIMVAIPPVL